MSRIYTERGNPEIIPVPKFILHLNQIIIHNGTNGRTRTKEKFHHIHFALVISIGDGVALLIYKSKWRNFLGFSIDFHIHQILHRWLVFTPDVESIFNNYLSIRETIHNFGHENDSKNQYDK